MKLNLSKITALAVFSALLVTSPLAACAQTASATNKPAATSTNVDETKPAKEKSSDSKGKKKKSYVPFKGDVSAVDKSAKTFTIGERVFQMTSETKVETADKKPAMFDSVTIGQHVTGSYQKGPHNELIAHSLYLGEKAADTKSTDKTTDTSAKKSGSAKKTPN
jgi:hypothetical protein